MSRTIRNVKHRYKKFRQLVINGEESFPFVYTSFRSFRHGELVKGRETNWNEFDRARYLHGFDGGNTKSISDFCVPSPKGYIGWKEITGPSSKRWYKKAASRCRRIYGKHLIDEFHNEDDGQEKAIPPRSSYKRKKLSRKESWESWWARRHHYDRKISSFTNEELEERKALREKWEGRSPS